MKLFIIENYAYQNLTHIAIRTEYDEFVDNFQILNDQGNINIYGPSRFPYKSIYIGGSYRKFHYMYHALARMFRL